MKAQADLNIADGICILFVGSLLCSCVSAPELKPFQRSEVPQDSAKREQLFRAQRVEKTIDLTSEVGGHSLDEDETLKYFEDSGGTRAAELMKSAIDQENDGRLIKNLISATGLLIGGISTFWLVSQPGTSVGCSVPELGDPCKALVGYTGAGLGAGVAAWIYGPTFELKYHLPASRKAQEAGHSFNEYLARELGIKIGPTFDGVGSSVEIHF